MMNLMEKRGIALSIDIICTIGPASSEPALLQELINHGMTVARLNMSHGDQDSHRKVIRLLRQWNEETGKQIRILGDLQGPKIRLGAIEGDKVQLEKGQTFVLYNTPVMGGKSKASVDYEGIVHDVKTGAPILINDGEVKLVVKAIATDHLETEVAVGGEIGSHKGVNLPGTNVSLPSMTDKDQTDIRFLMEENVEMIACSFIRTASHLEEIRFFAERSASRSPYLIAKMETMTGVKNFAEILSKSDGIMVARGDLGVELPFHWIPVLQKAMIQECLRTDTYVITATQMLQSMTDHPVPTRAEVTDIFQAVLDGTSAVMLSAESAAGKFPVESTETLKLVAHFAERVTAQEPFSLSDMIALLESRSVPGQLLIE
jgi:pyruvate kinase